MRHRRLARIAAFLLTIVWPVTSHACAVCFSGSPRIRQAFFNMTVFMSLFPLALIAAGLIWLRRGGRELLANEFEERDAFVPEEPETSRERAPLGVLPEATPHPAS